MAIKHHKIVSSLPGTLEADSIYYVRVGSGFDIYVTSNSSGLVVAQAHALVSTVSTHILDTANPHAVTKTQVGLGNVPNVDTTNATNITNFRPS